MGLYDLLMSAEHDAEVDFTRRLALTRGLLSSYFLYGREMRYPPLLTSHLRPNASLPALASARCSRATATSLFGRPQPSACPSSSLADPPAFLTSAWLLPVNASRVSSSPASLLFLITNPSAASASAFNASLSIDVRQWGLRASADSKYAVLSWSWDGQKTQLGVYGADAVKWSGAVGARAIVALTVQLAQGAVTETTAATLSGMSTD
jgi:hypothetical protein